MLSTGSNGWWQLAWSSVRGHPGEYRGAVTHAMTGDGAMACGRTLPAADTGATSDDEESPEPSCRQCRRKLGMDITTSNRDVQPVEPAGGVVSSQPVGDRRSTASSRIVQRPTVERLSAMSADLTPLQAKIVTLLSAQSRRRMNYHALMYALWPPEQHPKAWRNSSNGGPPGCAMAFGRALRQLQAARVVWESHQEAGRGDIGLTSANAKATGVPPAHATRER